MRKGGVLPLIETIGPVQVTPSIPFKNNDTTIKQVESVMMADCLSLACALMVWLMISTSKDGLVNRLSMFVQ